MELKGGGAVTAGMGSRSKEKTQKGKKGWKKR
jgi:hypothetical protein